MKWMWMSVPAAMLALCACNRSVEPQGPANAGQPANAGANEPPPPNAAGNESAPAVAPPSTGADARTPLAEPKGPIDPKSTEAAGQLVQSYGALIEQRRFAQAEKLWGDAGAGRTFAAELRKYPEVHLEIGDLGEPEGAAGSIYVTMPVVFYGKQTDGASFRRKADVILRRVNDVPGSTEEQRRWHIERIEWKAA